MFEEKDSLFISPCGPGCHFPSRLKIDNRMHYVIAEPSTLYPGIYVGAWWGMLGRFIAALLYTVNSNMTDFTLILEGRV